eukprot:m.218219 g.218219  ORF g.218219 m.218219 type:complete len:62 (+) comp15569_c0_seq5:926-1111(+)
MASSVNLGTRNQASSSTHVALESDGGSVAMRFEAGFSLLWVSMERQQSRCQVRPAFRKLPE